MLIRERARRIWYEQAIGNDWMESETPEIFVLGVRKGLEQFLLTGVDKNE